MSRRNRRAGGGRHGRWDDADGREPRRQERGRERPRRAERQRRQDAALPSPVEETPTMSFSLIVREEEPAAPTCGRCREFLADEVTGRGECLHPGSGVLRPWWDTPGCAFFQR